MHRQMYWNVTEKYQIHWLLVINNLPRVLKQGSNIGLFYCLSEVLTRPCKFLHAPREKKSLYLPFNLFFLRVGKWFIKRLTPVYFILLLFPISEPRDCGSEFGLNLLSRKSDKILPIKNQ